MAQQDAEDGDDGEPTENTVRRTPIYAHMADDGLSFCSYGVDYPILEDYGVDLEQVESAFYEVDGADPFINRLTPEGERTDEPPRIGTLTFGDDGVEDIDISLPATEPEYARDADGWPARDSGVPWGCSHAQAVLVLGGNAVVHEEGEGSARMSHFVAKEWYGPSPRFDQYNDGEDAVTTYKAMNPASTIYVRASDVARIQTPAGEELV